MERKNGFSSLDPFCLEKESKNKIREKLRRKKDLEEFRKESDRLYQEDLRQKILQERKQKNGKKSSRENKNGSKERKSWLLGVGSISAKEETVPSKVDSGKIRQTKSFAREKGDDRQIDSSPTVNFPNSSHKEVYHCSQFHISDLVTKSSKKKDNSEASEVAVMCRICQSDEDTLSNQLVSPCSCNGSLRYVHHLCLQQWRQTKKASGAEVKNCELCLKQYNTEMLGKTDVKPDHTRLMQENLRRLVRSGVYLMLLVDFCRDSVDNLLIERNQAISEGTTPADVDIQRIEVTGPSRNLQSNANETSGSEDDENYVSRSALKRQSERHRR